MLSIILPAYESADIADTSVSQLSSWLDQAGIAYEIIIVDDGSITPIVIQEHWGASVRVLRHKNNQGKGRAVQTGILQARGSVVGFTDIDLPYDLQVIRVAYDELRDNTGTHIVIGSRTHPQAHKTIGYGATRSLASKIFSVLTRKITGIPWKDSQCGIKFFTKDVAQQLFTDLHTPGFAFDVELLTRAHQENIKVVELPVRLVRNSQSTIRLVPQTIQMCKDIIAIRKRH